MDFAKNLLGKYGWKEGDGLGKNNDGICKPLKAAYKFNKSGLGHNQADDLNNHWWENVFNAAADNMNVSKDEDGVVSMERKTDESVEITTKNYSISSKADKNFYKGQFLRTSTLVNSGQEIEIADKDEVVFETVKMNPFKVVSDEALLRACEGRTVHKGARHGLKMSGKLARIEAQEREMLAKMGISYTEPIEQVVQNEWTKVKSKKRSKKDGNPVENASVLNEPIDETLQQADYHSKSHKKAKKQRKLDAELAQVFESVSVTAVSENLQVIPDENTPEIRKKKSKKNKIEKTIVDSSTNDQPAKVKTSKRKRLASETQVNGTDNTTTIDLTLADNDGIGRKKSKKRRHDADPSSHQSADAVDQYRKSEAVDIETSNREEDRKAAKAQRKKDRQVRRLAKEMDREMNIL